MMEVPSSLSTFTRGPFSFHLLLLFILLCFSLHLSKVLSFHDGKTSSFQCPNDHKSALLQLKAGFIIHRWNDSDSSKLDSWNHSTDYCSWEGITCDGSTRQVIELDLSGTYDLFSAFGSRISGRIDSSLFCLSSLQKLNLSLNDFYPHQIPSGLGHLTNLTHLDLCFSGFGGQVPFQISRLTRLHSLNLAVMQVSYDANGLVVGWASVGDLKIVDLKALVQNLSSLEELNLSGIKILAHDSQWSQALSSSLPNLRRLSLIDCDLAGPIHPSFSNLHFLSELDLSKNNLSSQVPHFFGNFFSLTTLRLWDCGLRGKFPRNIFLLPDLQTLDISENPFLAIDFPEFSPNHPLRSLWFTRTNLSGKLPNSFCNLKLLNSLAISDCNLFGPIPTVIANLTQLEYLDLSYNNFDGPMPSSFVENLKHLKRLEAQSCNLSGLLPLGFGNLTKLEYLDLGLNNFNGPIPSLFSFSSLSHLEFGNVSFSKLQYVSLADNVLHGPIPMSLFQLKELSSLYLSSNKLSGTLELQMFQDLRNLGSLDLSNNDLSIINAKWNSSLNFPKLWSLFLRSCNITEFPIFLQNQNQLAELDLSNNKISGIIPSWIWEIGNGSLNYLNLSHNILDSLEHPLPNFPSNGLQVLDLHSNKLKESPPKIHAPSLFYLDYSHNQFKSIIPSDINFTSMSYFFLSNNNVSGGIPQSICKAFQLEIFDLSHNNFTGSIPKCLCKITDSVKIFNLRENSLQGTMPQSFSRSCSLRTLDLSKNQFEGSLSRSLANCKTLEVLDIGHNMFNDTFPIWLGTLPQLRVLVLKSNKFHGPVVCHPKHTCWLRLQIIDLSFNAFTGNLSSKFFQSLKAMMGEVESQSNSSSQILRYEFKHYRGSFYQDSMTIAVKGNELEYVRILNVFTAIDFSNNGFEGEMPKSIGDLKLLHVLNFSHNGLIGHIPTSLENLTQLESLDLSQNKLSGKIPSELVELTFLEVLDLSKNDLTGRIPQGKQFLTFSNDSFSGNMGLCGSPLSKKCEDPPTPPDSNSAQELENFDWRFMWIGFGIGYGIGLGMVFWTLVLWKEGSKRYIKFIDRMFVMLSPSC